MSHKECPLCRHNYLSLDGDEDDELHLMDQRPTAPDPTSPFRNLQFLHVLQNLAEAPLNTTIRLDGLELGDGQRRTVEIQRSSARDPADDEIGVRIRVVPLDEEQFSPASPPSEELSQSTGTGRGISAGTASDQDRVAETELDDIAREIFDS